MDHTLFPCCQDSPTHHPSSNWVVPNAPTLIHTTPLPPTLGFKPPSPGFNVGPLPQPYSGTPTRAPYLGFDVPEQNQFYANNDTKPKRRLPSCPSPGYPNHPIFCPSSPRRASLQSLPLRSKQEQNQTSHRKDIGNQNSSITVTKPQRRSSSSNICPSPIYPKLPISCPGSPGRTSLQSLPLLSKDEHNQSSDLKDIGNPSPTITVPKQSPTVIAADHFNPRRDAEVLKKAMKGFGAHENTIIKLLTKRSNAQRVEIALKYKTLYGKNLTKELKSELSGSLEKTVVALMTPLRQYYAKELHNAIVGLGTDEAVLIEVLCTLPNTEIRAISTIYHKIYNKNLESDIKGDTSGDFRRFMVSLCSAGRDESMVTNSASAAEDAQALYNAKEKRWGTDGSIFNMILCERNHAQLRLIFQEYRRLTGHDIENTINSEFSGDIQEGFLAVIRSIKNQQAFFARRLYKSIKGLEAYDRDLIRLVVTRCESDMGDIKREYAANYKQSLGDAIKANTSGNYKRCLLALVGE
ncbi:hypothetical protein Zmor_026153 [Zophobas morio]|uniref:Annexin n=1 Tax=Zophobas morio TaxID=2755281 RepID=A0AA38HUS0_9CUCU|nr:hypothetical protein Zmor_026153 [Zophobas morio]